MEMLLKLSFLTNVKVTVPVCILHDKHYVSRHTGNMIQVDPWSKMVTPVLSGPRGDTQIPYS